jgi:myo-inositol-1(or 4)-monophosphatase
MQLEKLCLDVCKIAEEAGDFIRTEASRFSKDKIENKGLHDFVSYVDISSERMIVEKLSKLLPGSDFITEEGTAHASDAEFTWIIDPLDGTTNFIHGIDPHSVSIGLRKGTDLVTGVVLSVAAKELFYAWENGGAWLNGRKIKVSDASGIDNSLIATGFPFKNYSRLDNYLKCLEYFIRNSHGVRRMGSAAVDLSWVACGRYDAFFEYGLNPWDVAAGTVIIREAGGRVSNFSGDEEKIFGSETVAANSIIFDEFRRITGNFMNRSDS